MLPRTALTTSSSYKEIFERLAKLTTPLICDAYKDVRMMNQKIVPMNSKDQCLGRAYTVDSAQDSLSTMQALDDRIAFLAFLEVPDNDIVPIILMIASCGAPFALAGGMCIATAESKGFGGVVTDGLCRDIKEIQASSIPLFARGKCAKSGSKDKVGTIREPIECGGVKVNPGEIVFADVDGVVVMSKEEAVPAITKAEDIQEKEGIALQRIQGGARFNEICNIDEHVENLRSGIPSQLKLTL
jgi:4-hydroxy-4-methyl-2-oxoglutarate aldolase